jgi:hypothetical protein
MNKPSVDGKELIRPIEQPIFFPRPLCLASTLQFIQQPLESLHLFLLLQQHRHHDCLKRPRA